MTFNGWPGPGPPNGPFTINHRSHQAHGLKLWLPMTHNFKKDYTGINADSTITSTVALGNTKFGRLPTFVSGSELNPPTGMDVRAVPFTLSFWLYYNESITDPQRKVWDSSVDGSYFYKDYAATVWKWRVHNQTILCGNVFPFEWHHYVLSSILYNRISVVDGKFTAQGTAWHSTAAASYLNSIGTGTFSGRLFDFRYYNRRMAREEAESLYRNPWELFQPIAPSFSVIAPVAPAGRTTKNTDIQPLGLRAGMGRMITKVTA